MKKVLKAAIGTTALLVATSAFAQTATAGDAKTVGEDLGQVAKLHTENTVKSAMKFKEKTISGFGIIESIKFHGASWNRDEDTIHIQFESALDIAPEDRTLNNIGVGCSIDKSSPSFDKAADLKAGETITVTGQVGAEAWYGGGMAINLHGCEIL